MLKLIQMKEKNAIERYIHDMLEDNGALLFSVIDPVDYKTKGDAIKTAKMVMESGADIIVIGGSIGAQGELLDDVTLGIKEATHKPVVLFPGNIATITRHADAIYFMSLLNARNPYWITQAQMLSAPLIKSLGIEPLPVGYIVVHPGGTVGWVGDANFVPREKPHIAASLALAGQFLGNRFIITDTGSNPKLQNSGPVPLEMVREVRMAINVPYIVAGGVTTTDQLKNIYRSGADIVQVGTAFQDSWNASKKAKSFARVKAAAGLEKKKKG